MKKIISALLSLIMLFALCPAALFATDNGEEVTLTVSVGSYSSIQAGAVSVSYDSDVLELVSGSILIPGATGNVDSKGNAVFMALNPFSVSGSIMSVTFKVKAGVEHGTSTSVSAFVRLTPDGKDVSESEEITVSLGTVTVSCSHKNKESHKQQDATCKATGYTAGEYCPDCETWVSGHTLIPMLTTHNYGAWQKISDTQHKHICTVCEKEETANHTWDSGKVTKQATHLATGVMTYTCTGCGATKTETIPTTAGHTYGSWTKVDESTHKRSCECGASETANHTWDSGKVTTPATHTMAGVMTYTCTECDATKTETIPTTAGHTYGAWTKVDESTHKRSCECGASETANHTWDSGKVTKQATCKEPGVTTYTCTECGTTKVEPIAVLTTHSYGKWTKADDNLHKRTCSVCGNVETESHSWNAGVVTKAPTHMTEGATSYTCPICGATKTEPTAKLPEHDFGAWEKNDANTHKHTCECGEIATEPHTWNAGVVTKEATCKEDGVKTYTCTKCGEAKTETIAKLTTHTYSNDCDPDCDICGATREVTHQYRTEWSFDGVSHWHICAVCGVRDGEAAHTPGPEATETTPQVCSICGYILVPALGHTHSYAETYTVDENGHWYACAGCSEKKDYAAHVYDNACDKTCNICGYERVTEHTYDSAWRTDASGHWHECTVCGDKKDFEAHVPGQDATEDTPQICVVCGYVIKEALGHTHKFGSAWMYDEITHWHECKCGEKNEYVTHKYDIDIGTDKIVYTCECGYVKEQEIVRSQPVVIPVSRPVEKPKTDPGTEPGTDPGTDPETDPTTEPEPISGSATVSSELIEQITEVSDQGVIIDLGGGMSVEYDKEALSTIAETIGEEDVTLVVEQVVTETVEMTEQQKQTVFEVAKGSTVFSLSLKAGETEIHDFNGGKATVSMPFTLPEGWEASDVLVYRIEEDGTKTQMKAEYADGTVKWETDGHSYYLVTRTEETKTPADKPNNILPIIIIAVVAVMALAGVTLLIVKKKKS